MKFISRPYRMFFATCAVVVSTALLQACAEPDRPSINLYRAVRVGDIDQIERNIYWGVDVNAPGPEGQTPLHVAADRGRLVVTRLLLDNGAQIDARNRQGETPLYLALMSGRTQVADFLVKRGAAFDADSLLLAVAKTGVSDRDVIEYLVKRKANLEVQDADGDTPLHIAVIRGHRVVAKFLIAQGADVNSVNRGGKTPLALAITHEQEDIAMLLRRYGATLESTQ